MNDILDTLLIDLGAESATLRVVVGELTPDQWRTPTPAEGWDIAAQIAHLAWTDEVATKAATDKDAWDAVAVEAIADPEGYVDQQALRLAEDPDLLSRWQTSRTTLAEALRGVPAGTKLPWFGPPMSPASMATARFMETWAHALDVYDALGITRVPTDRIRHVVHLGVRTRDFAFGLHRLTPPTEEFSVTLVAPSGEVWSFGPEDATQTVTGTAYDFCRLVTQRAHRDDLELVAVGSDADTWLDIAQAFAGAPGPGREPAR